VSDELTRVLGRVVPCPSVAREALDRDRATVGRAAAEVAGATPRLAGKRI
jgi:hypothetical protein